VGVAAVVTAAGSGSRLGLAVPKALARVGDAPLVVHAVRAVQASGAVDHVVVTVPVQHRDAFAEVLAPLDVVCVVGGPTRQASVAAGLAAVPADARVVLVHDAARALTPPEVVARVVGAVLDGHPAVVPVVPVTDSVVSVVGEVRPVDRTTLRVSQTPQGFDRDALARAHRAAAARAATEGEAATDDVSLCAAIGIPVSVVDGHLDALKITLPVDLVVAESLLAARATVPSEAPGGRA
jgi:2-C-methyl-D-erythritol 4-phosphate cytidylyltransferase